MTRLAENTNRRPLTEHHNPMGRRDYLSIEHVERYRFALSTLEPCPVLDVASGSGYGTAILSERGFHAIGADYDAELLAMARSRFPHAYWVSADGSKLPFPDACFSSVVTFETIEHIEDGQAFLAEMRRVLRPGGKLICSTPNIAYTAHPPYHVREYRPDEFYDLVRDNFADMDRHGQYFRIRDRLRDLYCWHLQPRVLATADKIGARRMLKSLLRHEQRKEADVREDGEYNRKWIRTILSTPQDPDHRVQDYRGDRGLRIMIAVATKGG